ncbi:hypothetical protein PspLS_11778 [Pyricularia sp. CBS 133598]|nr:hypothetical protein PspLS_11778 [Pyricularia sp. CBS 133598]
MPKLELVAEDYHVAWVCPLPDVELTPARLMLDKEYEAPKYVARELDLGVGTEQDKDLLLNTIVRKADHSFLCASLVVGEILVERARGRNLRAQLNYVNILPVQLQQLYSSILGKIVLDVRIVSLRLFQ